MPALLRELHALIPSCGNSFFWCDENQQLSNLYDENPDSAQLAPLYVEEFYNRRECEVHSGFTQSMRHDRGVISRDQAVTVDKGTLYKSDLFNLIFRPLGYDDFVRLMVHDDGRTRGALQLWRTSKDPSFTRNEERCLARLQPFIAHALMPPVDLDVAFAESGENGLLIANSAGKPVYLSQQGRRLLFLATHPKMAPGRPSTQSSAFPPALEWICKNLAAVVTGKDSAPPVYRHHNVWGGFTFRAYRLEAAGPSPSLIGITVSRQEPLPLRLMREIEQLSLTDRQAQVCLLMATGLPYRAIADRLAISRHTVIAHSRWIYGKLAVSNHNELVRKLLS